MLPPNRSYAFVFMIASLARSTFGRVGRCITTSRQTASKHAGGQPQICLISHPYRYRQFLPFAPSVGTPPIVGLAGNTALKPLRLRQGSPIASFQSSRPILAHEHAVPSDRLLVDCSSENLAFSVPSTPFESIEESIKHETDQRGTPRVPRARHYNTISIGSDRAHRFVSISLEWERSFFLVPWTFWMKLFNG